MSSTILLNLEYSIK